MNVKMCDNNSQVQSVLVSQLPETHPKLTVICYDVDEINYARTSIAEIGKNFLRDD